MAVMLVCVCRNIISHQAERSPFHSHVSSRQRRRSRRQVNSQRAWPSRVDLDALPTAAGILMRLCWIRALQVHIHKWLTAGAEFRACTNHYDHKFSTLSESPQSLWWKAPPRFSEFRPLHIDWNSAKKSSEKNPVTLCRGKGSSFSKIAERTLKFTRWMHMRIWNWQGPSHQFVHMCACL